jgi:hypothetical protein
MNIDQFIRAIQDGGFGFSPTVIAVPFLTAELRRRDIHLSTLETHAFLEQLTSHFRYGKVKWDGKAPLVYAHRTLEGATTDRIRQELWLTDRYAREKARQREKDEATRRWLAQRGRVVEMKQY